MIEDLIPSFTQLGFPALAFLLMYKMANEAIKENTKALISLRVALSGEK